MRIHILLPLTLLYFLLGTPLLSQTMPSKVVGTWMNDHESALVIDSVGKGGALHGKYKSSTGVDGRTFAMNGWINSTLDSTDVYSLSFSVSWGDYGSITSWTGYIDLAKTPNEIFTLWHLVRPKTQFDWERIITNQSTFIKVQ